MKARTGRNWRASAVVVLLAMFVAACGGGSGAADIQSVDVEDLVNPASEPEEVYASVPEVNPPLSTGESRLVGSREMTEEDFVAAVGSNVNAMWQALFESGGYVYSNASMVLYEEPIPATGCEGVGVADPEMGPFYCLQNQTIYYPMSWTDPSSGQTPAEIGDFAVAVIIAHEVGHHIQNLLGVSADSSLLTIQKELQADCFAGIWARSAYEQGILEPGDIGEALQISANAADLPGTPVDDPSAHGTERERTDAFFTGYETGDIAECQY